MAKVTAIANEADKPPAFAAVVTRCQTLMFIMLVTGVNVFLRGLVVICRDDGSIAVLPQRVFAKWHSSRQDTATCEPEQHPSQYEVAKYLHQVKRTIVSVNGSVVEA